MLLLKNPLFSGIRIFSMGNYDCFSIQLYEGYPFGVYTKEIILDGMEEEMRVVNINCSIAKRIHFPSEKSHLYF